MVKKKEKINIDDDCRGELKLIADYSVQTDGILLITVDYLLQPIYDLIIWLQCIIQFE